MSRSRRDISPRETKCHGRTPVLATMLIRAEAEESRGPAIVGMKPEHGSDRHRLRRIHDNVAIGWDPSICPRPRASADRHYDEER
jgi:hypothetical protein